MRELLPTKRKITNLMNLKSHYEEVTNQNKSKCLKEKKKKICKYD